MTAIAKRPRGPDASPTALQSISHEHPDGRPRDAARTGALHELATYDQNPAPRSGSSLSEPDVHCADNSSNSGIVIATDGEPSSGPMPPLKFVIAGAPKAGTTWLYLNLNRNPSIFLPRNKEPRYYSINEGDHLSFHGPGDDGWLGHFVQNRHEYEALYAEAGVDQVCGEASTDYLYRSKIAAVRIHHDAPTARIIFLLRNPAYRAYSNWLHHVGDGRETLPFRDALNAEQGRIESGWAWWWHFVQRGFYAQQLERFLDLFPADQILVLLYDDLQRNPRALLERVCSFLGVEAHIDDQVMERRNRSLVARSALHGAVRRVLMPAVAPRALVPHQLQARLQYLVDRTTLHSPPAMAQEDYQMLRRIYFADIKRLADMIERDLSGWLD